jgi:hypothetical protein
VQLALRKSPGITSAWSRLVRICKSVSLGSKFASTYALRNEDCSLLAPRTIYQQSGSTSKGRDARFGLEMNVLADSNLGTNEPFGTISSCNTPNARPWSPQKLELPMEPLPSPLAVSKPAGSPRGLNSLVHRIVNAGETAYCDAIEDFHFDPLGVQLLIASRYLLCLRTVLPE